MTKDPLFITGNIPAGYTVDFDPFLYNNPPHLSLQSDSERLDFFMVNPKKKRITGRASFFIREAVAYSPLHAPFGSFELSAKATLDRVFQFTAFVCDHLKAKGVKKIIIKSYAGNYAPEESAKLATALYHQGFSFHPVINHHLAVDKCPFEEKIHPMERRKLKKCIAAGYRFSEEAAGALKDTFDFIRQCRQKKGQPVNIEFDHLQKSMSELPGKFSIFSLKNDNLLIAATIVVSVNKTVTYNFLPASLPEYNHHSPMIHLLSGLYEHCRGGGVEMLDLGISATEDHQQFSLMRFKGHLGAKCSLKFTYTREIPGEDVDQS